MLKIKRQHFNHVGSTMDYELENGTMLHASEWNGETYTVKENGQEISYRPVQIHNEEEDTWDTIGFEIA